MVWAVAPTIFQDFKAAQTVHTPTKIARFFVRVSANFRRRNAPVVYAVAADFCIAFYCDAYVILSRRGGQFASQIAMRYRLAATLMQGDFVGEYLH
jgi:hypothetical protein